MPYSTNSLLDAYDVRLTQTQRLAAQLLAQEWQKFEALAVQIQTANF